MNASRHRLNVLNLPSGIANHPTTLLRLPTNPILYPLHVIPERIGGMLQPASLIPHRMEVIFNRITDASQPTHHVIYRINDVFNPICHVSRGNPHFVAKEHKERKAIRLLRKAHLTVAASRQSAALFGNRNQPAFSRKPLRRFSVAAGILPAVEPWRPARRKERLNNQGTKGTKPAPLNLVPWFLRCSNPSARQVRAAGLQPSTTDETSAATTEARLHFPTPNLQP